MHLVTDITTTTPINFTLGKFLLGPRGTGSQLRPPSSSWCAHKDTVEKLLVVTPHASEAVHHAAACQ